MCDKLGISAGDKLHIRNNARNAYLDLVESLNESLATIKLLPNSYTGLLPDGDNIDCSSNFKIPQIFFEFKKELFMSGINLGFLLNLKSGTANFEEMLKVLMKNPTKRPPPKGGGFFSG
jgi:hypothetical protein